MRILLAVCFSTATWSAFHGSSVSDLCDPGLFMVTFHLHSDCPYKAQQFSPDRGYDLLFVLAGCEQAVVTLMQPVLSFPGDFFDLFAEPLLALAQSPTVAGTMSIGPGCLDHDPAEVSIARLGNLPACNQRGFQVRSNAQPISRREKASRITAK